MYQVILYLLLYCFCIVIVGCTIFVKVDYIYVCCLYYFRETEEAKCVQYLS